ncbi:MAG TPA: LuxR C-terminal-related transcriptional regulator [Nocardioides sp.]|nr:LuxR C-terminal-related transcriptional regulator [Nocardioides sp.]
MLSGRDRELHEAARLLRDGRAVQVVGEAGVGKTTVLRELAGAAGGEVFEGGALATIRWADYLPLSRALGREPTGADPEAVAHEVQETVGPDGVLVLDDLQWAATATLDVVGLLLGRVRLLLALRNGTPDARARADTLERAGCPRVALEPLDASAAVELARRVRPGLSEEELSNVLRRAGGNPLLIRELAAHGEPSTSLRRTVSARLRRLPPEDLDAFALVALAGRPLPHDLLGAETVERLTAASLVETDDGHVDVRHALLAEVVTGDLDPARRTELHRALGRLLPEPGESARHLHLAGERELCHAAALRAAELATRPGERAAHLRLAATSSAGADADGLRLAAAESLEAAHDWDGVFEMLDHVQATDPATTARAALIRMRAAWSGARLEDLRPSVEEGRAAAAKIGGDVEVLLGIEACRVPIFLDEDMEAGAAQARAALALAEQRGVGVARAHYFLGTALSSADRPGGPEHLARAVRLARAAGEVGTEMVAANNLVSFHESSGSPAVAVSLAREMADRGRSLGLGYWEANFQAQVLQLDFHAGRYDGLVDASERLARRPLDPRTRDNLVEVHLMALTDTGCADEAARRSEDAIRTASDEAARIHFWWTLAEAQLWGGHPRQALPAIERFLATIPESNPNRALGLVTRAWARYELGERPATVVPPQDRPFLLAVPHETAALDHAHADRSDLALEELRTAAALWAPYHLRGELRCEWAVGELLRRRGDLDDAVRVLTAVEKRCAEAGLVAVLHRARRSLRSAGERRTVPRSAGVGGLTAREQEVLELVGRGLTNDQIAARLGVTRRTVVTQVASASAKLGADNRLQAATLAARLVEGDS